MSEWFTGCAVVMALAASGGDIPRHVSPSARVRLPEPSIETLGTVRAAPQAIRQLNARGFSTGWLPVAAVVGYEVPSSEEPCDSGRSGMRCVPLGRYTDGVFHPAVELAQAAPEAETHPRRPTAVEHLRQAIEHLHGGGFHEEARQLERKLDETRQSQRAELERKRRQIEELRCEIAELEEELGLGNQFLLNLVIGEVDAAKLRESGVDFSCFTRLGGIDSLRPVRHSSSANAAPASEILKKAEFDTLMETLTAMDAVTIEARPALVTQAGRPAKLRSGGEFPILVPQPDGTSTTEFKEFGLSVDAIVHPLSDRRILLEVAPEVSQRDFRNAVRIDGSAVPGLTIRKAHSEVELTLGQTVILAMSSKTEDGKESVWFVACTPEKFSFPAETPKPGVRLVPIPEAYRNVPPSETQNR